MRPLRLTLQAFGSYPGEVTIDFVRLARHGIFAISGPTGAGKSTIFDALVYALYDDLPGFRVDGNVRSQYAADDVQTRVRLEFEVRGARWAVERTPTQLVRRRRGQGAPIERKSTVVLERLDGDGAPVPGSALSRKSAVSDVIDALVGLTKEQFEQVVLIPQGRFEEVLKADTKSRAVLLRRLFPVDVYGRVTGALKAMADERQRAFVDASRALDDLVGRLGEALTAALEAAGDTCDLDGGPEPGALDVADMARHLATLSSARLSLERKVDQALAEHERAVRALDEGCAAAEAWDRWRADTARAEAFATEEAADAAEATELARARRVSDLDVALQTWEEATARLARVEPECDSLRRRVAVAGRELGRPVDDALLTDAALAGRAAERFRHRAEVLAEGAARFDALVEARRSLDHRKAELEERRHVLDGRSDGLEADGGAIEALAHEIEELAQSALGGGAAAVAVERLEAEHVRCVRRAEAAEQLESAALARGQAALEAAAARAALDDVRTAWRNGLAGRLAELLVDGDACPTCGALEHPSPAVRLPEAPDDEALQAAEAACEKAQGALRLAENQHGAALGILDALSDARPLEVVAAELAELRAELEGCRDAAGRLTERRQALADREQVRAAASAAWQDDVRRLELDAAGIAAEEASHERARDEYEQRHGGWLSPAGEAAALAALAEDVDRLAELLRAMDEARTSERQCRSLLSPLLDELELDDPGALTAWRRSPQELAERAASLAARSEARAEVRRRLAEYDATGGPSARPDLEALAEAATSARARHREIVGRHAVMEDNAGFFAAGPSLLETATKEVDAARRALEQARTLADRCAGAGGGANPTRLSLENWVLADYLRHVLVQANERLATMTGGRFALQLSDGVTDGRKAWGLELSAFDAYTGQVRPATTLSGGETFMAALALALGLADVVSGGSNREMGALFVDEGFGSLDPQSLESVVDVLRSLEDGGRLVGVVSHVEAVQQALPNGITVRTTPCGSLAEVHYPQE